MARSVQLTGDWSHLKRVLDQAAPNIRKTSRRTLGQQVKKIEAAVLSHIDEQDLGWEALNEQYAKSKERKGLSPDILRASNTMYQNITTDQPDDFTAACGVKRGVKDANGQDVIDIALIHEQPDDDGKIIPARKLWQPTYTEMLPKLKASLRGIAIEVFRK